MKNDLADWLVKNRDKDGLSELFLEFDRKIEENKTVMINNVRSDESARFECGAHDALLAFKKFLMKPLEPTKSGLET